MTYPHIWLAFASTLMGLEKWMKYLPCVLVGPLPTMLVVCVYYSVRIGMSHVLTLFLMKILLMTAFIVNFSLMSGNAQKIVICSQASYSLDTAFNVEFS